VLSRVRTLRRWSATVRAAAATARGARGSPGRAARESERLLAESASRSRRNGDRRPRLQQTVVRSARELTRADSGSLLRARRRPRRPRARPCGSRSLRPAPDDGGTHLGAVLPLLRAHRSPATSRSAASTVRIRPMPYAVPAGAEYRVNRSFRRKRTATARCRLLAVPMRDHEGTRSSASSCLNQPQAGVRVCGLTSPAHTERSRRPFSERRRARAQARLRVRRPAVALGEQNAARVDRKPLRAVSFRARRSRRIEVRDKSTQVIPRAVADLTVLASRGGERDRLGDGSPTCTSTSISCGRCATHRCCTTSARSRSPSTIFGKAKKLPDGRIDAIRLRLPARDRADVRRPPPRQAGARLLAQVEHANEPRRDLDGAGGRLDALGPLTYRELRRVSVLCSMRRSSSSLRIPRGSLSGEERRKMEQHGHSIVLLPARGSRGRRRLGVTSPSSAYGHRRATRRNRVSRAGSKAPRSSLRFGCFTISDIFDALTANEPALQGGDAGRIGRSTFWCGSLRIGERSIGNLVGWCLSVNGCLNRYWLVR